MLLGLLFEPKSDIPRLHKSSIMGFHVQDKSDHPKPSEQLGRLDIIAKPILLGLLLSPLEKSGSPSPAFIMSSDLYSGVVGHRTMHQNAPSCEAYLG